MFPEISLHILDVAENSVRAKATQIDIEVRADSEQETLCITIRDNGCGMTEEELKNVTDPFFTTRTTRKVGLGVPFFKQAAEQSGGTFSIRSAQGKGTDVNAVFGLYHLDRMPLGDMPATIHTLITMHEEIDFLYLYQVDEGSFRLDTRELRSILGEVSFREAEVSNYILDFLRENTNEVTNGRVI